MGKFRMLKKTVVIAFATAQAVAGVVESHSWHQDKVDMVVIVKYMALRFWDLERP